MDWMKTKFNKDFFNEFSLCMHMTENACYIGLCSSQFAKFVTNFTDCLGLSIIQF